jgi:UDP-N-acetylglucosamine diphosphorylase/glucosamine-1-phosphate N-acetyltransferase
MNIILFDLPQSRLAMRPLTDTRPLAKIRLGITTIEEKWQASLLGTYSYLTADYLQAKFPPSIQATNYYINSAILPTPALVTAIEKLQLHEKLVQGDTVLALLTDQPLSNHDYETSLQQLAYRPISFEENIKQIQHKWDLFFYQEKSLQEDFQYIQSKTFSQSLQDPYTKVYNETNIYISDGAIIKAAVLNAESGPIYIGRQATIEEGAIIKGPVAICEGAQVKAGAIIHPATTIGPYAKVGGEVSNSIILGYSNKVHHGFLGSSILGEWCNLGAGTSTANLNNNYSPIKIWDYTQRKFVNTPLQHCGLFMGDYNKCGIHTMFNAGTTVGISTNLFGTGYHNKYVPSFTYGGIDNNQDDIYNLEKAIASASIMLQRRNQSLTEQDARILEHLAQKALTEWVQLRLVI